VERLHQARAARDAGRETRRHRPGRSLAAPWKNESESRIARGRRSTDR